MTASEMTDKVLRSYQRYYDIKRGEDVAPPFAAEAEFHTHDEQYMLVRSAKLAEQESNEYVFFANEAQLDADRLTLLDERAWNEGLSRVNPHGFHRNTDVTLVIIAESVSGEAAPLIKKLHHYQSYRWGLRGWSNYRLIVLELSSGLLIYNRRGRELRKMFRNILKK